MSIYNISLETSFPLVCFFKHLENCAIGDVNPTFLLTLSTVFLAVNFLLLRIL